jgi:hypothetical protein
MSQACTNVVSSTATRNPRRAAVHCDPIFRAIATQRAAVAAYYKAARGLGTEADKAWDALQDAEHAMNSTTPTTLAGMVAYLDRVADDSYIHSLFGDDDEYNDRICAFVREVRDGLKGVVG